MSTTTNQRVLMIVNPISGGGRMGSTVTRAAELFRKKGLIVELAQTAHKGDATRIARDAAEGTCAIVAVGGDGTVREVVEGAVDRDVPVAILPTGTENLVARFFGAKAEADKLVETVLLGRLVTCDVGVVNERRFLIMVGVGFDAEVVRRLTLKRRGHVSRWSYVGPFFQAWLKYRFPAIRVEVNGKLVFEDRGIVVAGVLPCYSIGLKIVPDSQPDDGLLDVCIMRCRTRMGMMHHMLWSFWGKQSGRNGVIYMRGKEIRVTSDDSVPVQADGDAFGVLPVRISVLPNAISFLVSSGFRTAHCRDQVTAGKVQ